MKKLGLIVMGFFVISSCTQSEYLVESDYDPDTEFDQYDSYYFASHARNDNVVFFLDDLTLKGNIREEVRNELEALGYNYTTSNPDLLVNFRVFEDPVNLQGYQQEDYDYWVEDVIDTDNIKTYNLDAGSLVVEMADAETGQVVWTGYASGLMNEGKFDKSKQAIASAVEKIYSEYDYRANEL